MTLWKPSRRTFLKTAAVGATGALAMPNIITHSMAQAKQITVADVGGTAGEAIKSAFCEPFAAKTGITVLNIAHQPDPTTEFKLLVDTDTHTWDACMIWPEVVHDLTMGEKNYLAPLGDVGSLPDEMIAGSINEHWVGFSVFASIFAYRTDVFPEESGPTSWADYFDIEKYPGRRGLLKGPSGPLAFALLADGVPLDELYPLDVDRAFAKLDTIKNDIAVWWTSGAQSTQILQNGEVDMSDSWSARAYAATASGAPVKTVWHGLYNVDGWAIPSNTPHLEEVQEFVKFCALPEQQGAYSSLVANGPCHKDAFKFIAEDRAKLLPTSPENIANLRPSDTEWEIANRDATTQRFDEWVLS